MQEIIAVGVGILALLVLFYALFVIYLLTRLTSNEFDACKKAVLSPDYKPKGVYGKYRAARKNSTLVIMKRGKIIKFCGARKDDEQHTINTITKSIKEYERQRGVRIGWDEDVYAEEVPKRSGQL